MYKKRGQATILIFLGIVVFSLVFGTYFARDYVFKSKTERMSEKALVVPRQAESVRDYIMSCIRQVSEEAADLAGQRGGIISIPGDPIPFGAYNTFSNNLEVLPNLRVPYWYYKAANSIDKFQIPNLEQIGKNIANYVDEQLRVCVGSFEAFKKKGYKINPGMIKTDVEIKNDRILFGIKFPLHMEIKDFKFDFKEFYYRLDKPLGELYDLARGIFNYENGKYFLEEKTIDMMVGYEEIPLTGESFECSAPIWDKYSVIERFKEIISYNVPSLKITGTNYGLKNTERSYFEVDVGANNEDVDVNFVYSGRWPFELEVTPEKNGILKAESMSSGLGKLRGIVEGLLCYSSWHFVYDIKYPVLVALSKDGYTFQYAIMVVIDRNEARKNAVIPISIPEVDTRFCDNRQFNLQISVYDDDGNPVDDADVSYKCINHVCELGKTTGNVFTGNVMPCGNGFAIANKDGYNPGMTQVSTLEDSFASVVMKKYKELSINAEVQRGGEGKLREDEKVYITLINEEDDYSTTVIYPDTKTLKLISGDYIVSMYMIKKSADKITIPGREVQNCVEVPKKGFTSIFGATETKCVTTKIPSIELDQAITGAVDFDMSVSRSDLDKDKITFYVPYQSVPRKYEDLLELSNEPGEDFAYPRFG